MLALLSEQRLHPLKSRPSKNIKHKAFQNKLLAVFGRAFSVQLLVLVLLSSVGMAASVQRPQQALSFSSSKTLECKFISSFKAPWPSKRVSVVAFKATRQSNEVNPSEAAPSVSFLHVLLTCLKS